MSRVIVVAAHADDEALGCGGTIAKHISLGDDVSVIFMTRGVASREGLNEVDSEENKRKNAASSALRELGVDNFHQFDFPDNKMDSVALLDIVTALEDVFSLFKPTVVYTHYLHDLNVDHQVTNKAVMTVCRPQRWSSVQRVLSFEVLSSSEWSSPSTMTFRPQYIVDISDQWCKKLNALKCYELEMREFPHSRSFEAVEALAILRGATHGFKKAEAFFVERILVGNDLQISRL